MCGKINGKKTAFSLYHINCIGLKCVNNCSSGSSAPHLFHVRWKNQRNLCVGSLFGAVGILFRPVALFPNCSKSAGNVQFVLCRCAVQTRAISNRLRIMESSVNNLKDFFIARLFVVTIRDFFDGTSLHGFKYLIKKGLTTFEKLRKVVCFSFEFYLLI